MKLLSWFRDLLSSKESTDETTDVVKECPCGQEFRLEDSFVGHKENWSEQTMVESLSKRVDKRMRNHASSEDDHRVCEKCSPNETTIFVGDTAGSKLGGHKRTHGDY